MKGKDRKDVDDVVVSGALIPQYNLSWLSVEAKDKLPRWYGSLTGQLSLVGRSRLWRFNSALLLILAPRGIEVL
jgi:hypothetical protein